MQEEVEEDDEELIEETKQEDFDESNLNNESHVENNSNVDTNLNETLSRLAQLEVSNLIFNTDITQSIKIVYKKSKKIEKINK